jgi:hypothetical protein
VFQQWVESIRDSLQFPDKSTEEVGEFVGTPAYKDKKGQIYAVWLETGVKIPKVPPKPTEIEPRKKKLIEEAEEKEKERFEVEKPKKKRGRPKKGEEKTPLPKKDEKKPTKPTKPKKEEKKPVEKEKGRPTPLKDKNRAKELLLEEFKLGLITKKEYRVKVQKIEDMYGKGGKI